MKVVKVTSNDSKTEEWDTNKNMYIRLVRINVRTEKGFVPILFQPAVHYHPAAYTVLQTRFSWIFCSVHWLFNPMVGIDVSCYYGLGQNKCYFVINAR